MVWMNQQDKTVTELVQVKPNQKETGWILQGVDFDVFCWNSDKLLSHLITALQAWNDRGTGQKLEIRRSTTEKRGFTVEVVKLKNPKDCPVWIKAGLGFKIQTAEDIADEVNPFL